MRDIDCALFEIERQAIEGASGGLRRAEFDSSLPAKDERRNIVDGRLKSRPLADGGYRCRAGQEVQHQVDGVNSGIVERVCSTRVRVKFPACIRSILVKPKAPLHGHTQKFAECVAGNDLAECSDSRLMSEVVGDSERDWTRRQERLDSFRLRRRQAQQFLTQDRDIPLGT